MKKYIERNLTEIIISRLQQFSVVAVLGPRQCGKSTLVKQILRNFPSSLYLDLELQSDYNKLSDPEAFFVLNKNNLICLDEVQRKTEIFPIIRGIVDQMVNKGQFIVLGSASPSLLRQSSESLAGRIALLDLTPFTILELDSSYLIRHWQRGGFPDRLLADSDEKSIIWRENFIRTYLERDIPSLGFRITTNIIQRLWIMLAHMSGQIFNSSKLGASLGVSYSTVRTYLEILEQTYMVRILQPYYTNIKKRLIKSPKVYIRDTGILHSLLGIEDQNSLMGNPVYGNSWES
ncbi:MAG: ATP-binding protein, partial [Spirochaetales bacterium]|nr:ATP-binding protein [Spirochaetales bacterium]